MGVDGVDGVNGLFFPWGWVGKPFLEDGFQSEVEGTIVDGEAEVIADAGKESLFSLEVGELAIVAISIVSDTLMHEDGSHDGGAFQSVWIGECRSEELGFIKRHQRLLEHLPTML